MMSTSKRERAGRRGALLCRLVLLGLGMLSLVATACGGAQQRPAAPSERLSGAAEDDERRVAGDEALSSSESSTAQASLEAFNRAAGRFASLSGAWVASGQVSTADDDVDGGGARDRAPGAPPAAQARFDSATEVAEKKARTRAKPDGQMCPRACEAFASMKRSAESLCTLVGEAEDTCHSVRERLASARERVREWCPACEAARADEP